MLIDFHTHFFPLKLFQAIWNWFELRQWPIAYKHEAEILIQTLKKEGVTQAVALHYPHKPGMAKALNQWTRELFEANPDFIIPFGSVHPDDSHMEEILEECLDGYGFKGIKIHCHVQRVAPEDPRLIPLYETLNAKKKILLIHCGCGPSIKDNSVGGYGYDTQTVSGVGRMRKVMAQYPHIKFVIPHLGYDEIEETFGLLKEFPHLYLDTSMALSKQFKVTLKKEWFVEFQDRLLYGTDFPIISHPYLTEKNNLLAMNLGKAIEEKIFFKNAQRLLTF